MQRSDTVKPLEPNRRYSIATSSSSKSNAARRTARQSVLRAQHDNPNGPRSATRQKSRANASSRRPGFFTRAVGRGGPRGDEVSRIAEIACRCGSVAQCRGKSGSHQDAIAPAKGQPLNCTDSTRPADRTGRVIGLTDPLPFAVFPLPSRSLNGLSVCHSVPWPPLHCPIHGDRSDLWHDGRRTNGDQRRA
jgi:hypothetical protein